MNQGTPWAAAATHGFKIRPSRDDPFLLDPVVTWTPVSKDL
jgi:hypothetical protein